MKKYSFKEHFLEFKTRILKIIFFYILFFGISYFFKENLLDYFLDPLIKLSEGKERKIIYTSLTEAFFSYIKLTLFSAFLVTLPFICYNIYSFIEPGLYKFEKKIIRILLILSPVLFYIGVFFVVHIVMPKAWEFFLSFEQNNDILPIVMEAKISEYLALVIQLTVAFGLAFQLPVIMVILCVIGIIDSEMLKNKRRVSIVLIFIVAAIFTPPDVISQIALAIPLIFLYEISIILCRVVKNQKG